MNQMLIQNYLGIDAQRQFNCTTVVEMNGLWKNDTLRMNIIKGVAILDKE